MRGAWLEAVVLVAACLAAAASCGEEFEGGATPTGVGATTGSGGGATGGAGGAGGAGGECGPTDWVCTECEYDSCPDEYCACKANPQCVALAFCIGSCPVGYNPCVQTCYTQNPDGISAGALVSDCAAVHCPVDCPAAAPLPACNGCLFADCPDEMNACLADAECAELVYCVNACPSGPPTCVDDCLIDYTGPGPLRLGLDSCLVANCNAECDWAIGN